MLNKRHGSTLTAALVMTGVIFAMGTAMVSMVGGQKRKAESERWQSTAEDAAQTGLNMVLAWARSNAERMRAMPRSWDVLDGTVLNPLASFVEDESFTQQRHGLPVVNRNTLGNPGILPPDIAEPGDLIGMNQDGTITAGRPAEYVVATVGNNVVVTFRPRLQVFKMDDDQARLYKITVSGRVYRYNKPGNGNRGVAPFQNWDLIADKVLGATTGRLPLSRFATLIDVDLVRNWVPGEISDGPIHINRGYIDAAGGLRPIGVNLANGRSQMMLNAPGAFGNVTVDGVGYDRPVFRDTVSFTHRTTAQVPPPAPPNADTVDTAITAAANPAPGPLAVISTSGGAPTTYLPGRPKGGQMFTSPDNATGLQGGPGPIVMRENIEMPTNSRGRFSSALGMPQTMLPTDLPWLQTLKDGVYVPSQQMVRPGPATTYGSGQGAAGGIYIRGNVEVMRIATVENPPSTIYAFQVRGHGTASAINRRVYTVKVFRDNSARVEIKGHANGSRIGDSSVVGLSNVAMTANNGDGQTMDAWSVEGTSNLHTMLQRVGGGPGWNGMIFVDYGHHDPIRAGGAGSTNLRAPNTGVEPRTGHVLALGQVGNHAAPGAGVMNNWTKTNPGGVAAGLPAPFTGAEVYSSEIVTNPMVYTPPPMAPRVTLIASGNVFIQNHILTHNVIRQVVTTTGAFNLNTVNTGLVRDNVLLSRGRDLFGVVADRQVVVGFAAPRQTNRSLPGLVFTGAVSALGDPSYRYDINAIDTIPGGGADGIPAVGTPSYKTFSFRGSLATEGLIPLMIPNEREDYRVGAPGAATWTLAGPPTYAPTSPLDNPNSVYREELLAYSSNTITNAFGLYDSSARNPNVEARGKLLFFGSVIQRKRGVVGLGNRSFDKAYRYDQRLLSVAPPLFPNAINLVTYVSKIGLVQKALGNGIPVYTGDEFRMLNTPPGAAGAGVM